MSGKLKDYQVLDVLCGGTFYKVRHKVTNNIFAWKAYDCSAYSDEQIQNVISEVKTIKNVKCASLLRFYDTILHGPSKTLYIVLEHNAWQSLEELTALCKATDKHVAEGFIWHLLLELARVIKAVEPLHCVALRRYVSSASIFVSERCELRINCFDLTATAPERDVMRQVGDVIHVLCLPQSGGDELDRNNTHFSSDLQDVIMFLRDEKNTNMRPDVLLYHPTVLANMETFTAPRHLSDILVAQHLSHMSAEINKCDAEKAVELGKAVEPAPRTRFHIQDSPIYCNITPKHKPSLKVVEDSFSDHGSLSPTLAALALELPGFVPRCRKPYSQALERYDPQRVSQETLSQQWMSRLIALRQREESLNKRERDLIAKEIVNSPSAKVIQLNESVDCGRDSNGITLPSFVQPCGEGVGGFPQPRRRRAGSMRTRPRRKSYAYEDLDSSLSADPGDESLVITATKFTHENMPRRNIFPAMSSKKVHFTPSNPFVESDESVMLTFYELENLDKKVPQVAEPQQNTIKDINKFKYLDLEKLTSEKRAAMQVWTPESPSKQAKMSKQVFSDITNVNCMRKTPSKSSLTSKGSNSSRYSMASCRSHWSMESAEAKVTEGNVSERTRARTREPSAQTPAKVPEVKKSRRKSLLPFKTPFKFMTATKI